MAVPAIPLGIPGEWVWNRHALPAQIMEAFDRLFLPVLSGAVLLSVAGFGDRRIERYTVVGRTGLLLLLLVSGTFWIHGVQQAAPSPHREVKSLWISYDRFASGYFYEAVFRIKDSKSLLTGYEAWMREGDVGHIGTHPPGLFLLSCLALEATVRSPDLVRVLEAIRQPEAMSMFRQLEAESRLARPLTRTEFAALQLISLISLLAAGMTVLPLFLLARQVSDSTTAWRCACLFLTVPAVVVFCPKSDVIYPLTMTTFLWLGTRSFLPGSALQRTAAACGAAISLFVGMLLSLAHLPAVVLLAGFVGLISFRQSLPAQRNTLLAGGVMAGTFLLTVTAWTYRTGCPLFVIWKLNLTNHANFYDHSTRTTWKWLLCNIPELALSVGAPLFVAAVFGCFKSVKTVVAALRRGNTTLLSGSRTIPPGAALILASAATWIVLWLSGKNSGEAARLWCFLTPWLALAASICWNSRSAGNLPDGPVAGGCSNIQPLTAHDSPAAMWRMLMLLQIISAVVTAGRVNGFSV